MTTIFQPFSRAFHMLHELLLPSAHNNHGSNPSFREKIYAISVQREKFAIKFHHME